MILITGASSGIGAATARAFARKGHALYLLARQTDRLEAVATEIRRDFAVQVKTAVLDVSSSEAVQAWETAAKSDLESISVLINNAGLAKGLDFFVDSKPSDWDAMIDTNLKGLLQMTQILLKQFKKKNMGHIVNLGSVAGLYPYPKGHVYNATKFAVRGFTEALRMDLLGTAIRVTEISPGMVETNFSRVRLEDESKAKAVYQGMTPLTADDIADAIVWCADRPARVNIQELVIYPTDQASPTMVHRKS